jgi:SAM-dependent methyltransferase
MDKSRVESNAAHRRAFGSLSHAEWLRVLERSLHDRVVDAVPMPAFPPQEYQTATHGTSGRVTIAEAGRFVALVSRYADAEGRPVGEATRVLDFGCGWGRMLRIFLNRVDSQNLHGVDVRPESVALARQLNPFSRFTAVDGLPPAPFDDGTFDLVVAYSVFSHLSEAASRAWIREIARVLAPGGLAIVTTQGSGFLDFVESLSTRAFLWRVRLMLGRWRGRPRNEHWLRLLRDGFGDIAATRRQFAGGQFVHVATGGGSGLEASLYGESIIPRAYVEREWTELALVDFIDDRRRLPQALIVLRKPSQSS